MARYQQQVSIREKILSCDECGKNLPFKLVSCAKCKARNKEREYEGYDCGPECRAFAVAQFKETRQWASNARRVWDGHLRGQFCNGRCHAANARQAKQIISRLQEIKQWLPGAKSLVRSAGRKARQRS